MKKFKPVVKARKYKKEKVLKFRPKGKPIDDETICLNCQLPISICDCIGLPIEAEQDANDDLEY